MAEEKPARRRTSTPKETSPSTPTEASNGWTAWHQPKVFIPLVAAVLMAVGIAVTFFASKERKGHGGDSINTTIQQPQTVAAAPANNSADQGRPRDAQGGMHQSSRPNHYSPRMQSGRTAPPQPSPPPVAQQPEVSIHVDHSPGAITAGTINANSIEVRPPQ